MSRIEKCPFCEKQAVTENAQAIPVCVAHKKEKLPDLKCSCGDWLDVKKGKYGTYFSCMRCGNISFGKGLEMNNI